MTVAEEPAAQLSIVATPPPEDTGATFEDLSDAIARHARERPDDRAVVLDGQALTWWQFDQRLNRIAHALIGLGIRPNDKVAMLATTSLNYFCALWGTLRAGACAVPLSTMAAAASLELMVKDSESRVLMLSESQWDLAGPFAEGLTGIVPGGFIGLDFARPGWTAFDDLIADRPATSPGVPIDPAGHFNIIYSSGTTGTPKGILHSRELRWKTVQSAILRGFDATARTLLSTPLYSNTTMAAMLPTLFHGGTCVLQAKFDAAQWLKLAEGERITHTMLVPVQYQRLLSHPDFDRADLSSMRLKLSTSAPLRAPVKRDAVARFPGALLEIYGLTEGGAACVLPANDFPDKLHTVGRPAPGCEIRLIDEAGQVVPWGGIGEIAGRGPAMMQGYYNNDTKTREFIWEAPDGSVFFRQGDMGRFDDDGFLVLLDRKKDMIISGGFNIYATDLEVELMQHPDVVDAAVIGIPSDDWGETPLGLVVRRDGATASADDLKAFVNGRVGKLQRLSGVEFRDELPRSSIGKILKRELRDPYWQGEQKI